MREEKEDYLRLREWEREHYRGVRERNRRDALFIGLVIAALYNLLILMSVASVGYTALAVPAAATLWFRRKASRGQVSAAVMEPLGPVHMMLIPSRFIVCLLFETALGALPALWFGGLWVYAACVDAAEGQWSTAASVAASFSHLWAVWKAEKLFSTYDSSPTDAATKEKK